MNIENRLKELASINDSKNENNTNTSLDTFTDDEPVSTFEPEPKETSSTPDQTEQKDSETK